MGPRQVWTIVTVAVVLLALGGGWYLTHPARDEATLASPSDIADFRRQMRSSGMDSCTSSAKASLASHGTTLSDQAVQSYCDCALTHVDTSMSDQDVSRVIDAMQRTHTPPSEALDRFLTAAKSCQDQLKPATASP